MVVAVSSVPMPRSWSGMSSPSEAVSPVIPLVISGSSRSASPARSTPRWRKLSVVTVTEVVVARSSEAAALVEVDPIARSAPGAVSRSIERVTLVEAGRRREAVGERGLVACTVDAQPVLAGRKRGEREPPVGRGRRALGAPDHRDARTGDRQPGAGIDDQPAQS